MFSAVEVPTLKTKGVEILSEAIFSGKIKPGERLNESQLSRELMISRAPIREALQQLEEQGLVVNKARRGMFVVHLEPEDVQKINSVRLILESECLRLVRARLSPAAEAKLLQLLEKVERSESASPNVRVRLDFEFHKTIWGATENEYLERALIALSGPLFAHSVLRIMKSDKIRHIIYSHRPLLAFIQGKAKPPAETIMAEHLNLPWGPVQAS
ncbi:MAG: GntR family transcriptional regulator [Bryobacteraceae bacterium]